MYVKFGNIDAARCVFDNMPQKKTTSWNAMVSGYVRLGFFVDATELFVEMLGRGVEINSFVIASLLSAFSRSDYMIFEGFEIHALAIKLGLLHDVFVGTSLLHFYGVYGLHTAAQKLFQQMPERNVVSWTALMVGLSDAENFQEVFSTFRLMRLAGVHCNQNTFTTVISSAATLDDVYLGLQVFGNVVKSGFEANLSVANALISMFGGFGHPEDSLYVFDHMDEHDTISWNSIISAFVHNQCSEEAFQFFSLMRSCHNEIDSTTLSTLSMVCGTTENLKFGEGIHGMVVKLGWKSNACMCNTLLCMYSQSGSYRDANHLFDEIPEKDLISWNSMMACYVLEGSTTDALKILDKLLHMRKELSHVTFASALAACSDVEYLVEGKAVHALVIVSGILGNLIVGNALLTMYAKCGMMLEAGEVFRRMPKHGLVTWNALIGGYADNEETKEAVKAFNLMRECGEPANYITMTNVLSSCLCRGDLLKYGMPLHAHNLLTGFEEDEYVRNSLIAMYARCGDLNSSNAIFDRLVNKTSVAWNAILTANAHHGNLEEALKLVLEMQRAKIDFDQFSLSAAMTASANMAALEEGQQLHTFSTKLGFESHPYVVNAAMDMYGKCGDIDAVLKLLPEPSARLRFSWNVLISAFARHGSFHKARDTFHHMLSRGIKPDHVTFVSLLSACSHSGLVDEGLQYYALMTPKFGVSVGIEHCVCIVDLLGRSGRLDEAEAFIKDMPIEPNDFIWRSLLAACRTYGDADRGKKAAEFLLESKQTDDSAYVLYSNVCATSGRWQDVQNLRSRMDSINVKKQPACSWIKFNSKLSTFGIGDKSHPQSQQIYEKLGELRKKIKEQGYVANTSFALHDTDEEQKEHDLWNHSERLALAYGLISTPEGTALRIFKNLRVCGDCHSVFKFVSSLLERDIIMRDPYRFHHFSGGKCSCGDYW